MKRKLLLINVLLFLVANVVAGQSISVNNSDSVEKGNDAQLSITYTNSNSNDIIYAAIELKDADNNWVSTIAESTLNPVGESGSDVSKMLTLSIPDSAVLTNDLPSGQYYAFKIELNKEAWGGWLAGTYPRVTIVAKGTLGLEMVEQDFTRVFPNPVKETLHILPVNELEFKEYKIFGVSGKLFVNNKLEALDLDVSKLSKGMYFLQLDNNTPIKFLKN